MQKDNAHRSLQGLVSVNAWFSQDPANDRRFTLHADVAFIEERLGGDSETKVVFKISVKKCHIVFVPPMGAEFSIDPASVRSPRPLNPKAITEKATKVGKVGGKGVLSLAPNAVEVQARGEAAGTVETFKEVSSEQLHSMYNEIWRRVRGNHAWEVDGRELENKRLAGSVFDAHKEPRLTLIDRRADEKRRQDLNNNIPPMATIQVSCLREDLDIYDIQYKEREGESMTDRVMKNISENKMMVAREALKEALVREGLSAGDVTADPYSELVIYDVAISIIDSST